MPVTLRLMAIPVFYLTFSTLSTPRCQYPYQQGLRRNINARSNDIEHSESTISSELGYSLVLRISDSGTA